MSLEKYGVLVSCRHLNVAELQRREHLNLISHAEECDIMIFLTLFRISEILVIICVKSKILHSLQGKA